MSWKKNFYIGMIVFFLALFSVGCQSTSDGNLSESDVQKVGCAATEISEVDEIIIGATVPLSEPGAIIGGEAMKAAFQMAVDEINQGGGIQGKPVQLLIEDTAGIPEQGKEIATELIEENCVVAIVGEYHSAVGLEIMEVVHQYHTPTIFAETYSDAITASGYPEVFRIAPTSSFTAQMDAKWLAEVGDFNQDGRISSIIVAENSNYGEAQLASVSTWFPEYGIEFDPISVEFNERDFSFALNQIAFLDDPPDTIIIKVTGDSSLVLLNQIIEAGIAPNEKTLVVANQVALNDGQYWQQVPNGEYVIVPRIGPWSSIVNPLGMSFAEKYYDLFEKWPEAYAFEAYDSLWLMVDAITRSGSLDPDEIIQALEQTDIELASGHYYFPYGTKNPAEGFVPDYMWHQWPDVPLLFLQYTERNQNSEDMSVIWPETYRTSEGAVVIPK